MTEDDVTPLPPPPSEYLDELHAEIARTAAQLRPESTAGLIATAMLVDGKVNLALSVVVRAGDHFEFGGHLGAAWGKPISGGGTIKLQW